jgi:hypothetical protein
MGRRKYYTCGGLQSKELEDIKMYRLEIREPYTKNNCNGSYERKAAPVLHTWKMKCVAISEDKQALTNYAEQLPLEMFYARERKYVIE